jgi:hypothetical protein
VRRQLSGKNYLKVTLVAGRDEKESLEREKREERRQRGGEKERGEI